MRESPCWFHHGVALRSDPHQAGDSNFGRESYGVLKSYHLTQSYLFLLYMYIYIYTFELLLLLNLTLAFIVVSVIFFDKVTGFEHPLGGGQTQKPSGSKPDIPNENGQGPGTFRMLTAFHGIQHGVCVENVQGPGRFAEDWTFLA